MSNNFQSPGVTVREVRSGVPQIRGVPTSIAGFIGACARGPYGVAVYVTSFAQFVRIFGTYFSGSFLAEQVQQYFDNGGSSCYIVRTVASSGGTNAPAAITMSSGGAASSGSVSSAAASFPVSLAAGDTLIGSVNGAGAITATIQATRATKTGAAATYAAPTAGHTLVINVTGVSGNQTVTFAGTENSEVKYLAAIESQTRGLNALDNGSGQVTLETEQEGSAAAGSIVSGSSDVLAALGLTVGAFVNAGPNNVANVDLVAASEIAALQTSLFTGSTTTANANNSISWNSNTTGAASSVQYTGGTAVAKISGLDNNLHAGSNSGTLAVLTLTTTGPGSDNDAFTAVSTKQNLTLGVGIPTTVAAGSVASVTLPTAYVPRITVGDTISFSDSSNSVVCRQVVSKIQNNTVIFQAAMTVPTGGLNAATTSVINETFSLAILYNGKVVQGPMTGLRMSSLSAQNYFVSRLGVVKPTTYGQNSLSDEYVCTATDLAAVATNVDLRPLNVNTNGTGDPFTGGTEATSFADLDYIGNVAANPPTGFYALNPVKTVRSLACPGVTGQSSPGFVSQQLMQYAQNRADCVAVFGAPFGMSPTNVNNYVGNSIGSSSYGVIYYPNLVWISPVTNQRALTPVEGSTLGMWARTDTNQGVAKAPAGEFTGQLEDVVDVERVLADADYQLIYPNNINGIFNIDGVGVCVMGSRTLDIPGGNFSQIHVRRTFIYLEQSLKIGTRFVIFEPNTPATRAKLKRTTDAFLEKSWRSGLLEGDTLAEAFTSICDDTNNPDVIVSAQQMVEDVFVNVPGTVENLIINIQQSLSGQSTLAAG